MIKKLDLNINDIVINKNPYKGETPFKIVSEPDENNFILLATLDRNSLKWDYDFKELMQVQCLQSNYVQIDNFEFWLEKNKADIIWRTNVWKLERLFNE